MQAGPRSRGITSFGHAVFAGVCVIHFGCRPARAVAALRRAVAALPGVPSLVGIRLRTGPMDAAPAKPRETPRAIQARPGAAERLGSQDPTLRPDACPPASESCAPESQARLSHRLDGLQAFKSGIRPARSRRRRPAARRPWDAGAG